MRSRPCLLRTLVPCTIDFSQPLPAMLASPYLPALQTLVSSMIQYTKTVPLMRFTILAGMKHLCEAVRGKHRVSILVMGIAADCLVRASRSRAILAGSNTGHMGTVLYRHFLSRRSLTGSNAGHVGTVQAPAGVGSRAEQVPLAPSSLHPVRPLQDLYPEMFQSADTAPEAVPSGNCTGMGFSWRVKLRSFPCSPLLFSLCRVCTLSSCRSWPSAQRGRQRP